MRIRRIPSGFAALTLATSMWAIAAAAQTPAALPPPVPPRIEALKDLHRATSLVRDGRAEAVEVVPATGEYDAAAARIVAAVRERTGVTLPVVSDAAPEAAVPLRGNLVALGNR